MGLGIMTRDQLVTEVCDIVGKNLSGLAVSGTVLQTRVQSYYLNWAQQRIARFYNFHELESIQENAALAVGVKRYPFSTGTNNLGLTNVKDIGSIILLDAYNSRRLIRMGRVQFEKHFTRPENFAAGRSRIYIRVADSIEVFCIPDQAYSLRIISHLWPTLFSSSSQTSDFENKDQLIVVATVMETYLALEEYADASIWLSKLTGMLTDARAAEGDIDWSPQAEPFNSPNIGTLSGSPWTEPGAATDDPLFGYPYA